MDKLNIIIVFLFIVITYLYVFNKPNKKEHFANIIDNGSFTGGKMSKNTGGDTVGNTIIKLANPGKSSYVLQQTSKKGHKTRYQINLDVTPDTTYQLSAWVTNTNDWNGNYNIFNVVLHKSCVGTTVLTDKGTFVKRSKIKGHKGELLWELRKYIFNIPANSNGKIEIYMGYDPKNTKGYRYITDIELSKYNESIQDVPLNQDMLTCFLSTYHDNGIKKTSNVWKDLSNSGSDFKFKNKIDLSDNYIEVEKNSAIGPSSENLIPNDKEFTIVWSGVMPNKSKGNIFEIYANNDYNTGVRAYHSNKVGSNSKLNVSIGAHNYKSNTHIIYEVGITQKHTTYMLVKNKTKIDLYVEGTKIESKDDPAKKPYNTIPLEINNKKVVLNKLTGDCDPTCDTKAKLDFFIVFKKALSKTELDKLQDYINSYRVSARSNYLQRPDLNSSARCAAASSILSKKATSNNKIISKFTVGSSKQILGENSSPKTCPFRTDIDGGPCNSLECCGVDWSTIDNLPDRCKLVINSYCANSNDSKCNSLKMDYVDKVQSQTCSSSTSILKNLESENLLKIKSNCKVQKSKNNEQLKSKPLPNIDLSKYIHKKDIPKCPKICNMNDYIHKSKVPEYDMSKYIRKDKIPCWGCNLK